MLFVSYNIHKGIRPAPQKTTLPIINQQIKSHSIVFTRTQQAVYLLKWKGYQEEIIISIFHYT